MLDTVPIRTIADIAREEEVDSEIVEACLFTHDTRHPCSSFASPS